MSTADYARPPDTFAGKINSALTKAISSDKSVVFGGQLIKHGMAGLTYGLYEKYPDQFITYSVSESLMNSSAMGLSLAGKRPVMFHVRMDFLASGMCALVNHIPVWHKALGRLPMVVLCQIGRGMGQGAQHSKDLTPWFDKFEGWHTYVPKTPDQAHDMMLDAIFGDRPVMYVIHRDFFDSTVERDVPNNSKIRLCGASQRHEKAFYADDV